MNFQAMIDTQQNILNLLKGEQISELFRDHVYRASIADFNTHQNITIRYEDSQNMLIGVENNILHQDQDRPIEFQSIPSFQRDITLYIRKSEWHPAGGNIRDALCHYRSRISSSDSNVFYHFKHMPLLDRRITQVILANYSSFYIDIVATKPMNIDLEFSILAYPVLKKED